jgi:predicted  nucleic acid-binding Zn-ribbon protein
MGSMKKKQQKITTIEDLATLMQNEFLVIHEKFREVHEKMDAGFRDVYKKMDTGFRSVNERLDSVEHEVKGLRMEFEDLKLRVDQTAYHFEIQGIEKRLRKLELRFAK